MYTHHTISLTKVKLKLKLKTSTIEIENGEKLENGKNFLSSTISFFLHNLHFFFLLLIVFLQSLNKNFVREGQLQTNKRTKRKKKNSEEKILLEFLRLPPIISSFSSSSLTPQPKYDILPLSCFSISIGLVERNDITCDALIIIIIIITTLSNFTHFDFYKNKYIGILIP